MKTYYILALCLWMVSPSLAQDMSIFSQRSSDLVSQFPSLMAFHGAMDANVLYRSHWAGIGAGANASGYVHPIRSAIGLSHQYLRFGASRVHSTHFAISPRMAVSEDLMLTSALGLNIGTHNVKAFPSNEGGLVIYPNPTRDRLTMQLNAGNDMHDLQVQVFNITGGLVLQRNVQALASGQTVDMDVSSLPAGTYQLSIESETVQTVKSFVKH